MTDKMTELVRRADVQDEIDRWLDSVGTVLVGKGLSYYGELIGCLEDAPAADVAPVRHGKWVKIGADKRGRGGIWQCSLCKRCELFVTDYCPNCGAKMDQEAET